MSASGREASGALAADGPALRSDARVSLLDQALWRRLAEATDAADIAAPWLALQCDLIGGVSCGMVVLAPPGGPSRLVAEQPKGGDAASRLADVVQLALEQKRGVVRKPDEIAGRPATRIAYPLLVDGGVLGVAALELAEGADLRAAMRQLQWGMAWLRERLRRDQAAHREDQQRRIGDAFDLIAVALEEARFGAACRAVATEIAARLGCERVGIGFVKRGRVALAAISHSAQFGKQMNLVRLLGAAMDEAVDQRAVIVVPAPPDQPHLIRVHEELARSHGSQAILTTPLFVQDRFIGAMIFERAACPFEAGEVALLECVASALGAILEDKKRNDRWLIVKILDALAEQARRLLGPGHYARKLAVAASCAIVALAYFVTDTYRVTADAVVEGRIQRSVVVSFNGYIKEATARAGDLVREGQVLASLDERDLALERLRWVTERQRKLYEYDRALGERNPSETRIAAAQIEQADAQIRLADEQLSRTKLHAPFDGVVVSGDLSQSIGAAVQRGQVLFEIAPLDSYRVILEVDESQIGDVAEGQAGELLVASLPSEPFRLTVDRITPVAKSRDGRNFFRVEARLDAASPQLRPGMKGAGKVDVDRRRVVWIWSRSMLNWMRIALWRWFG